MRSAVAEPGRPKGQSSRPRSPRSRPSPSESGDSGPARPRGLSPAGPSRPWGLSPVIGASDRPCGLPNGVARVVGDPTLPIVAGAVSAEAAVSTAEAEVPREVNCVPVEVGTTLVSAEAAGRLVVNPVAVVVGATLLPFASAVAGLVIADAGTGRGVGGRGAGSAFATPVLSPTMGRPMPPAITALATSCLIFIAHSS